MRDPKKKKKQSGFLAVVKFQTIKETSRVTFGKLIFTVATSKAATAMRVACSLDGCSASADVDALLFSVGDVGIAIAAFVG